MARSRTPRFESLKQFAELLAYLPIYRRTVPGVFDLMAQTTLRRSSDGNGYELRYPRDYEAQVFENSAPWAAMVNFDDLRCPTKVIGAGPTLAHPYLPTLDLSHMLTEDYDFQLAPRLPALRQGGHDGRAQLLQAHGRRLWAAPESVFRRPWSAEMSSIGGAGGAVNYLPSFVPPFPMRRMRLLLPRPQFACGVDVPESRV